MKVRVKGTDVCKSCFYGGDYSEGCTYMTINRKSRLIENGERYNPEFCTKFEEGGKETGEIWKKRRREKWSNGRYI